MLLPPLGYTDFLNLWKDAAVVITGLVIIVVVSSVSFGLASAISMGDSGQVATLLRAGIAYGYLARSPITWPNPQPKPRPIRVYTAAELTALREELGDEHGPMSSLPPRRV